MRRHLILNICACAVTGILGCSQQPEQEVSRPIPVAEDAESELELPPGESLATVTDGPTDGTANHELRPETGAAAETPLDAPLDRPAESEGSKDTVSPEPTESGPSPVDAASVIHDVTAFYAALDSIRVTSEMSPRIVDDRGLVVPNTSAPPQLREVLVQRPNRFSIRGASESLRIVASDGNLLTACLAAQSRYLQLQAPASLSELTADPLLTQLIATSPTQMIPLRLLSGDSGLLSVLDLSNAETAAMEAIDGVMSNRITLTQDGGFVWNLWVAAEGDPLLLQASVTQGTRKVQLPDRGETEITIQMVEKLYDWELNPELSDEEFTIAAPPTAVQMQQIDEFLSPEPDDAEDG